MKTQQDLDELKRRWLGEWRELSLELVGYLIRLEDLIQSLFAPQGMCCNFCQNEAVFDGWIRNGSMLRKTSVCDEHKDLLIESQT